MSTSRFLQTIEEIMERDEGVEVSSQHVDAELVDQIVVASPGGGESVSGVSETQLF